MFAEDSGSSSADSVGSEGEPSTGEAVAAAWNGRRKMSAASGDSSSSSSSTMGLSEECVQCLIATSCVGVFLEKCEEVLGLPSSNTTASSSTATSDAAAANFSALLAELDLEPSGGVRASGGYVTIENATQCDNFELDWGHTESFGRFFFGLEERDVFIVDAYAPGVPAPVVVAGCDSLCPRASSFRTVGVGRKTVRASARIWPRV
ncbi:unnamed protein product [Ectocarpus sp. 6 AP-2014]